MHIASRWRGQMTSRLWQCFTRSSSTRCNTWANCSLVRRKYCWNFSLWSWSSLTRWWKVPFDFRSFKISCTQNRCCLCCFFSPLFLSRIQIINSNRSFFTSLDSFDCVGAILLMHRDKKKMTKTCPAAPCLWIYTQESPLAIPHIFSRCRSAAVPLPFSFRAYGFPP